MSTQTSDTKVIMSGAVAVSSEEEVPAEVSLRVEDLREEGPNPGRVEEDLQEGGSLLVVQGLVGSL